MIITINRKHSTKEIQRHDDIKFRLNEAELLQNIVSPKSRLNV
jgi:hypothetical protein